MCGHSMKYEIFGDELKLLSGLKSVKIRKVYAQPMIKPKFAGDNAKIGTHKPLKIDNVSSNVIFRNEPQSIVNISK